MIEEHIEDVDYVKAPKTGKEDSTIIKIYKY